MIKILADVNVEKAIVDFLREQDFDVIWIPDYNCKLSDEDLLKFANKDKRIIITNDKDFGELVYHQKKVKTGIILIRIKGQEVNKKLRSLKKLFRFYKNKIENHFIVISERRIRIRILGDIK